MEKHVELTESFCDIYLLFQPFYLATKRHSISEQKLGDLGNEFNCLQNQFVHFDFWITFGPIRNKTLRYLLSRLEAHFAPFFSREGYVLFCREANDNFEDRYLPAL